MICQCGGILKSSEHSIKSINKANEWAQGLYQEKDLPLYVAQLVCDSCGRLGYKIKNSKGELIKRFNL